MSHTPGPWVVTPSTGSLGEFQIETIHKNAPIYVAEVIGGLESVEQEANARLIAAAPEMFAVIERLMSEPTWRTNDNDLWPQIVAAHKKATGAA